MIVNGINDHTQQGRAAAHEGSVWDGVIPDPWDPRLDNSPAAGGVRRAWSVLVSIGGKPPTPVTAPGS